MATICSSMSWLTLTVLVVFGSCSWTLAGGQTCSLSADQLSLPTVTVSAESVDGSTPAARVTWNTTVPPECVALVTVQFRTSRYGPVVATYTTTNTSQTEIIQTGLQCATNYYIRVVVTGATSDGSTVSSSSVQVFIGDIPTPFEVRAEVTADNTIRVSWQWSRHGTPQLKMVTAVNSTSVVLSWSEVHCFSGSGAVTHYLVQYHSSCCGGGTVQNVTTDGLVQVISGLTPNTVYTFRVAAVGTGQAIGPFSNPTNTSLPDTPSSAWTVVAGVALAAVVILLVFVLMALVIHHKRYIARMKGVSSEAEPSEKSRLIGAAVKDCFTNRQSDHVP